MHSSALIAPFLTAGVAVGFVAPPLGSPAGGGGTRQHFGSRPQQRASTAVAMCSTVPPQLPDVNQNLSGGDFDR